MHTLSMKWRSSRQLKVVDQVLSKTSEPGHIADVEDRMCSAHGEYVQILKVGGHAMVHKSKSLNAVRNILKGAGLFKAASEKRY